MRHWVAVEVYLPLAHLNIFHDCPATYRAEFILLMRIQMVSTLRGAARSFDLFLASPWNLLMDLRFLTLGLAFPLPHHESFEAAFHGHANITRACGIMFWTFSTGWLDADNASATWAMSWMFSGSCIWSCGLVSHISKRCSSSQGIKTWCCYLWRILLETCTCPLPSEICIRVSTFSMIIRRETSYRPEFKNPLAWYSIIFWKFHETDKYNQNNRMENWFKKNMEIMKPEGMLHTVLISINMHLSKPTSSEFRGTNVHDKKQNQHTKYLHQEMKNWQTLILATP